MPEGRDPYRILQVDPQADPDVIAAAFRVLARKLHPDRGSTDAARMAELNWAYGLLRDPESRARHERDRRLGRGQQRPAAGMPSGSGSDGRAGAPWGPGMRAGDSRLDFGRYHGWTLREVARQDLEYLRWLSRHASGAPHRQEIAALLWEMDPPTTTARNVRGRR